jgi:hypothetical protein
MLQELREITTTMSTSPAQFTANRANAHHSTGPTSDAGKATSSQNAMRHGLTGATVVLPTDDKNEFQRFCDEIITCLEPENPVEREFAQIVANSQWRLKRITSIEDGLLAASPLGDSEGMARTFIDNTRAFSNLSHYENRLYRTMTNALKQLKDLQSARNKQDEVIEAKANHLFNMWKYTSPNPFGGPEPAAPAPVEPATPAPEPHVVLSPVTVVLSPRIPDQRRERLVIGFVFPTSEKAPLGLLEFTLPAPSPTLKPENPLA